MYHDLFERNVMYVRDLFDERGTPLAYREFMTRFHINRFPFSLYFGMINSIPRGWRPRSGEGVNADNGSGWFERVMEATSTSQFMYNHHIKTFTCRPTALYKWDRDFGHLTDLDWQIFFKCPVLKQVKRNYITYS